MQKNAPFELWRRTPVTPVLILCGMATVAVGTGIYW